MALGSSSLSTKVVELASGVDALYLSGQCDLDQPLLSALAAGREHAQEIGSSVPFEFGGYDWQLKPSSLGRYKFWLDHPLTALGISPRDQLPALRVQTRSEALHSFGAPFMVRWIESATTNAGLAPRFTVSRIDLHADWQHWALAGDDRHRFVCRARDLATYEDDFELSGFSFGTRKSKSVTARIYDKTREIAGNGHDWWYEVWGAAYEDNGPVLRTEFEFHRNALREMELSDPVATLDNIDRLWAYATQQWLTYRCPSKHERPARWPVSEEWRQVQRGSLAGTALPMERIRASRCASSLYRLMPFLNGVVGSFAAIGGHDTIDDACRALPTHLRVYEQRSGRTFCDRVAEKRARQQ